MSQPILITGPRARDVVQVLPEGWVVRDYLAAPLQVLLALDLHPIIHLHPIIQEVS